MTAPSGPQFKPGEELVLAANYLSKLHYALLGALCVVVVTVAGGGLVYFYTHDFASSLIPLIVAIWPIHDALILGEEIVKVHVKVRELRGLAKRR